MKESNVNKLGEAMKLDTAITELSTAIVNLQPKNYEEIVSSIETFDPFIRRNIEIIADWIGLNSTSPVAPVETVEVSDDETNVMTTAKESPTIEEPSTEPTDVSVKKKRNVSKLTEDEVRKICEVFVECGFNTQSTIRKCKERNFRCSFGSMNLIRNKKKYSDISDEYFIITEDGKIKLPEEKTAVDYKTEIIKNGGVITEMINNCETLDEAIQIFFEKLHLDYRLTDIDLIIPILDGIRERGDTSTSMIQGYVNYTYEGISVNAGLVYNVIKHKVGKKWYNKFVATKETVKS